MPIGFALVAATLDLQRANPFAPPQASIHYAPDRTFDLLHVAIDLDVDYPTRTYVGKAVNSLVPLRSGLKEIMMNAGPVMTISSVTVDGVAAKTRRDGRKLFIAVPPTVRGKKMVVAIAYKASNSKATGFGGSGGGFHWTEKGNSNDPVRVGFWTQGETEYNSDWVPTWDYPNDFATYDETYTVQSDWSAIGNGRLVKETKSADGKKKTFVWKQEKPHATYLLTAVGGPFDIVKDQWEDVPLWYVVPKGLGKYAMDTFGDTPDMLGFFSKRLGYKYPWAKYAQNAVFDFGGGMENVSATTLDQASITEAREGFRNAASLTSHELAHQWFGDTVTCQDWGDIFNNESFATFLQALYFEHSRGKNAYLWEVESNQRSYLAEARRYQRPVITNLYRDGDAMFDSHTYPKGGDILHTLRKYMGDEAFFAGLGLYLNTYQHTPVQAPQLERSLEMASGLNVEWFFDQWFRKPGHPVIEYDWKADGGNVVVTIKQTQDTANGTPIYRVPNATLGVISNGALKKVPFVLDGATQTVTIPATGATAVVLDPDHDFLRVLSRTTPLTEAEHIAILKAVADPAQRTASMSALLEKPSPAAIEAVVAAASADRGIAPALRSLNDLADLKKPELRSFWLAELSQGKNAQRKAGAVNALAELPADPATTQALRAAINDKEYIAVVTNAIRALAAWDKTGNRDVFARAEKIADRRGQIARAARAAMG